MTDPTAAAQRLLPVAFELRTHADSHDAVVGAFDLGIREGQLGGEEQLLPSVQDFDAASVAARIWTNWKYRPRLGAHRPDPGTA